MLHWRAHGKELFFRGQNLESNDLLVMSAEVTTGRTFTASTPKVSFKFVRSTAIAGTSVLMDSGLCSPSMSRRERRSSTVDL